jgi:tetratricopeptide (TPR) repeat protein
MVEWRGMHRIAFTRIIFSGLAFLLIIPNAIATASSLRDEAVGYREEGYQAQQRGDKTTALTWYQKAALLDPSYATPNNDLGVLLEEAGRFEEAEQSYKKALESNPGYLEAHTNLALLYERLGQREKAIYHWMKRYQFGDSADPWTARAEERLVALGVFKQYPGLKGKVYTRRHVLGEEFKAYDQSLEDFDAVTKQYHDWP